MTKQEFIDKVADEAGLTRRDAQKAVDAVLDTITGTLKGGGEINFTGFGKFSTSDRAARQGVNPRTGERVQIAATTVPKFSAGSALKSAVKASRVGVGGSESGGAGPESGGGGYETGGGGSDGGM